MIRRLHLQSTSRTAFVLLGAPGYQLFAQVGLHRNRAAVFFEHGEASGAGCRSPRRAVFDRRIRFAGSQHRTPQLFHEP